MNKIKRISAVALAALMAGTAVVASADYVYDENGLYIKDGVLAIASEDVTEVVIPDNVTEIQFYAFYGCTNLKSVTIPNSVTKIAATAFDDSGLKTIYGVKGSYAETYAKENGYEFKSISDTSVTPTPQKVVYNSATDVLGDVDGDGKTSAKDATAILKYVVGIAKFEGNSMKNALVTGGEKPSARDATQILKMVVGLA
ncbi:MAG: leucine-rich repeat protein [Oscillospiraceae bacterium]|nr:leucine-rich repeat protein [Oscillospiraceae bacterium]